MKEVGFDKIAFGVESANDHVLKNIKKGENIATIEESIRRACELGFDVDLFFIIGSPGETLEDVQRSFALAIRYPIANANFYNIVLFPTTELFKWVTDHGYFLISPDEIMNDTSHFINKPCFFTPEMSADDRKRAFKMGQGVSKCIRRKFIERKLNGPLFMKKVFSWIYTVPLIDGIINGNRLVVILKEKFKRLVVK